MIKTTIGLPNTCSVSGEPCTDYWYAENVDAARSGAGISEAEFKRQFGKKAVPEAIPEPTLPPVAPTLPADDVKK